MIRTEITRVTPAKIEHDYRVSRESDILAEGHVVLAVVDAQGNVQRVPKFLNPFA